MEKKFFDIIFTYTAPQSGFVRVQASTAEAASMIVKDALKNIDLTIDEITEVFNIGLEETALEEQTEMDLAPSSTTLN